jgi:hypothetical protein
VNAAFDCGEWDDDDKEKYDTYLPLAEKAQVAREKLSAAIAALKHAQQAVESERDKALEEVGQALLDAGYGEAYEVVYKLQSQQPAQADKDKP